MPRWGMSPQYIGSDQLHPEGENEVWQVKQELELEEVFYNNNKKWVRKEETNKQRQKERKD